MLVQAEEHHIICPLKWYKTSLVAKYGVIQIVFDYQNSIDLDYVKTFLADNYDIR